MAQQAPANINSQIHDRDKAIYIGNIPFDADADEVLKTFQQIGKVVSFRAPVDPETSRLRGFAFCEFGEKQCVEVAIKHFNGFSFNGRPLKVDSATKPDSEQKVLAKVQEQVWGASCEPNEAPAVIARVVNQLSPEMIRTIVIESKDSLLMNPHETRQAFARYPQVAYALLLCLVKQGQLSARDASAMLYQNLPVVPSQPAPTPPAVRAATSLPPPVSQSALQAPMRAPLPPGRSPGFSQSPRTPLTPSSNSSPSPAVAGTSSSSGQHSWSAQDEAKAKLLMKVVKMTDAEILKLPPGQRDQIWQLRQQLHGVSPGSAPR